MSHPLLKGPRLSYACLEHNNVFEKKKHKFNKQKKKITETVQMVKGGYYVFTPMGQFYNLTHQEAEKQGFLKQAKVINIEQANNTDTPAGKFKLALNDGARKKAWEEMEDQLIRACGMSRRNLDLVTVDTHKEIDHGA